MNKCSNGHEIEGATCSMCYREAWERAEKLEKERNDYCDDLRVEVGISEGLKKDLAESQAREKKMRDALVASRGFIKERLPYIETNDIDLALKEDPDAKP